MTFLHFKQLLKVGDFKGFFGGGLRNVLYLIYIYFLLQSRLKVRPLLPSTHMQCVCPGTVCT